MSNSLDTADAVVFYNISSKSDKYGMKIFWFCDADNTYALNGIVDVGKLPNEGRRMNHGATVVMELPQLEKNFPRNFVLTVRPPWSVTSKKKIIAFCY